MNALVLIQMRCTKGHLRQLPAVSLPVTARGNFRCDGDCPWPPFVCVCGAAPRSLRAVTR